MKIAGRVLLSCVFIVALVACGDEERKPPPSQSHTDGGAAPITATGTPTSTAPGTGQPPAPPKGGW